jgi:TRAP-type C4-dicarboxylate transport system permease small subunit
MLRKAELGAAALAVLLLVGCSLSIILLRLFATSPWSISAVDTLSSYPSHLMLMSALLGGSLALSRGETLKIEVFNNLLSPKAKAFVMRIVAVFAVLLYLTFLALAIRYLTIDYRPVVAFGYLPLFTLLGIKLIWISLKGN